MRARSMVLMAALAMVFSLLIGFNQPPAKAQLAQNQVLRMSVDATDLGNADPHLGSGTHHRILYDLMFNGLVRYAPGQYPELEPDLAREMPTAEIVDGRQVWTFHLREGVMTHPFVGYPNGYELTSADVVYSMQRVQDPERSTYASDYDGWTFEAVDDYTVAITLPEPQSEALFLPLVADYMGGMIVPKVADEFLGPRYRMQPVGTGPFKFVEYRPQDRIVLEAHSDYFRDRPILDEVHLVYIAEIGTAEIALRRGELEAVLGPLEQPWVERMRTYDGIKVDVYGPGENVTLHYNANKPPLDSLEIRKAVSYALSREMMQAMFGQDIALPTHSIVPYGFLPGGVSEQELRAAGFDWELDYDPEKAKEILAREGYADGFTLTAYASEREYYLRPYQLVQEALRNVGITLDLTVVDHATFHDRIRQDTNHLTFYNAWRPSADMFLTRFFHSASRVVDGERPDTNFSYAHTVDGQIEGARGELDASRQEELWKDAQMALTEDALYTSFVLLQLTTARRDTVDWGHPIVASASLYPQIDETTSIRQSAD